MCTSNHPVGTTYASAPTKTVTAGGTTYAYRELGPKGGIPVVFLVHLAANLDNWDPASSTRSPGTVTSSRSTMSASVHHPGRFPTRSKRWQRTPTTFISAFDFDTVDLFTFSMGGASSPRI